jgi:hypothetical protein
MASDTITSPAEFNRNSSDDKILGLLAQMQHRTSRRDSMSEARDSGAQGVGYRAG